VRTDRLEPEHSLATRPKPAASTGQACQAWPHCRRGSSSAPFLSGYV